MRQNELLYMPIKLGMVNSAHQQLCLEVDSCTQYVTIAPSNGSDAQLFYANPETGTIQSKLNHKFLAIENEKVSHGAMIITSADMGRNNQRFEWSKSEKVTLKDHSNYCFHATNEKERVILHEYTGEKNQSFFIYSDLAVGGSYEDKTFENYAWLTAHNAFANYGDARWAAPNQVKSIESQLAYGVRGFMLDINYYYKSNWLCFFSFGSDCYSDGVYLCHGAANPGSPEWAVAGINYALPRQTLKATMDTIVNFLIDNPNEIVTIFLEDNMPLNDWGNEKLSAVLNVPKIQNLIFDPSDSQWEVAYNGWPKISDLIQANKRLLIMNNRGERDVVPGVNYDQKFNTENYWSIGDLGNDYTCRTRWGRVPLNSKINGIYERLFVMNHFRNVPTLITAAIDNDYDKLIDRIENQAKPAAEKYPNFLAVDFVEVSNEGALRAVQEINNRR